jgi:hypothetical protein
MNSQVFVGTMMFESGFKTKTEIQILHFIGCERKVSIYIQKKKIFTDKRFM